MTKGYTGVFIVLSVDGLYNRLIEHLPCDVHPTSQVKEEAIMDETKQVCVACKKVDRG